MDDFNKTSEDKKKDHDPLIGKTIGGCLLEDRIGVGGMGSIYRGHHTVLDKDFAIKIIPPYLANQRETALRFLREARAIARLDHPNIVRVANAGFDQGYLFIAMEYVDGESLDDRLERTGAIAWQEAVAIAHEVARGLIKAHDLGIIHRDIKPGNILISHQGDVKITDFGLNRSMVAGEDRLSKKGEILGTPSFMAPEQATGRKVDLRTDIYALGATLYTMLTGKEPFVGTTAINTILKLIREEAPPLKEIKPNLPDNVVEVVECLMAKKPEDRYSSARDALTALKKLTRAASISPAKSRLRKAVSHSNATDLIPPESLPHKSQPVEVPSAAASAEPTAVEPITSPAAKGPQAKQLVKSESVAPSSPAVSTPVAKTGMDVGKPATTTGETKKESSEIQVAPPAVVKGVSGGKVQPSTGRPSDSPASTQTSIASTNSEASGSTRDSAVDSFKITPIKTEDGTEETVELEIVPKSTSPAPSSPAASGLIAVTSRQENVGRTVKRKSKLSPKAQSNAKGKSVTSIRRTTAGLSPASSGIMKPGSSSSRPKVKKLKIMTSGPGASGIVPANKQRRPVPSSKGLSGSGIYTVKKTPASINEAKKARVRASLARSAKKQVPKAVLGSSGIYPSNPNQPVTSRKRTPSESKRRRKGTSAALPVKQADMSRSGIYQVETKRPRVKKVPLRESGRSGIYPSQKKRKTAHLKAMAASAKSRSTRVVRPGSKPKGPVRRKKVMPLQHTTVRHGPASSGLHPLPYKQMTSARTPHGMAGRSGGPSSSGIHPLTQRKRPSGPPKVPTAKERPTSQEVERSIFNTAPFSKWWLWAILAALLILLVVFIVV